MGGRAQVLNVRTHSWRLAPLARAPRTQASDPRLHTSQLPVFVLISSSMNLRGGARRSNDRRPSSRFGAQTHTKWRRWRDGRAADRSGPNCQPHAMKASAPHVAPIMMAPDDPTLSICTGNGRRCAWRRGVVSNLCFAETKPRAARVECEQGKGERVR